MSNVTQNPSIIRGGTLRGLMHQEFMQNRNMFEFHSNRQDSYKTVTLMQGMVNVGVIGDGMGSGTHTEIGASLIADHMAFAIANRMADYIAFNDVSALAVPKLMADFASEALNKYLVALVNLQYGNINAHLANTAIQNFVYNYLMSTCLIIVSYTYNDITKTFVLFRGDGFIVTRDTKTNVLETYKITQDHDDNGYVLYPANDIGKSTIRGFHVYDLEQSFAQGDIDLVAIVSDAWDEIDLQHQPKFFDPTDDDNEFIIDALFFGRTMDMVALNKDDLTIVAIERINKEGSNTRVSMEGIMF